jgi:DNA (cytosine-5)-methyltransferase 1
MNPAPKTIRVADLFCGAGGTSTGAVEALGSLGYRVELTAVNHWAVAVETHSANHPGARHYCASLDSLNPRDLFAEGELDVLLASPECMSHSNARGGRPVNDQSRATAWCVLRWADALRPPLILIENVPEFEHWAPIGSNGRPLPSRRGEVFAAWCDALRALGYTVGHRVHCAADHGDPTTRRRLFIQAVRGRRKVVWPHATHAEDVAPTLFGRSLKPWRAARGVIDWTLKGRSIFGRRKPLAAKTLARIYAGLERFGLKPFMVEPGHGDKAGRQQHRTTDVERPVGTVPCSNRFALAEPYIVQVNHGNGADPNGDARRVRPVGEPLPTVCGTRGEWAVCEPFVVPNFGERAGQPPRAHAIDVPLPTVTGHGAGALVEPMILPQQSNGLLRPVTQPMPTVAGAGAIGLLEPMLVEFYGNGQAQRVTDPLPTVTTKDRFGLVRPVVVLSGARYELDILFRMLQPAELAGAQGFPASYIFKGNKTQTVKQIGNAVPRRLARALVYAMVAQDPNVPDLDGTGVAA